MNLMLTDETVTDYDTSDNQDPERFKAHENHLSVVYRMADSA